MRSDGHTYPVASGKQNHSFLTSPKWVDGYLRQFYPKTIAKDICTTKMPGNMIGSGKSARYIFTKAPKGEFYKYVDGQSLTSVKLHTTQSEMYIDRSYYYSFESSYLDEVMIKDHAVLIKEHHINCAKALAVKVDKEILEYLPTQVHKCNQGKRAGRHSSMYNLGSIGAPIQITPQNIYENIAKLDAVLMEADVDSLGTKPYLVMPSRAMHYMRVSPVAVSAYASGMSHSSLISGDIAEETSLIKYAFSNQMPTYTDPVTGELCFKLIAGYKEATLFHAALDKMETDIVDPHSFGKYNRMLSVFGMHTIYPEGLAMMYCTFKNFET